MVWRIELLGTQLSIANLHYEEVVTLTLPTRLARTLLLLADESPALIDAVKRGWV